MLEESAPDFVDKKKNSVQVTWMTVIKNYYAMMALGCIFGGTWNGNYWRPVFESYFELMGNKHIASIAALT